MNPIGMYALDSFEETEHNSHAETKPELNLMCKIWLGCKPPQKQVDWQVAEQQRWYQKEQQCMEEVLETTKYVGVQQGIGEMTSSM